jgi:hypothetical protein
MHSVKPQGSGGKEGFGEGPLGTKLHKSATAVKYPRPTRVKNKTSAPTQASIPPSPPKKNSPQNCAKPTLKKLGLAIATPPPTLPTPASISRRRRPPPRPTSSAAKHLKNKPTTFTNARTQLSSLSSDPPLRSRLSRSCARRRRGRRRITRRPSRRSRTWRSLRSTA